MNSNKNVSVICRKGNKGKYVAIEKTNHSHPFIGTDIDG